MGKGMKITLTFTEPWSEIIEVEGDSLEELYTSLSRKLKRYNKQLERYVINLSNSMVKQDPNLIVALGYYTTSIDKEKLRDYLKNKYGGM